MHVGYLNVLILAVALATALRITVDLAASMLTFRQRAWDSTA